MKKNLLFLLGVLFAATLWAQTPQKFNYQAVARNTAGNLIANQAVSFRLGIRDVTATGTLVYQETHAVTTNQFGLVNLQVGSGTVISGDFATIDWGTGSKFLQVELDATGGSTYVTMGTPQLLSVPYALYAQNANVPGIAGPTGPTGNDGTPGAIGPTGANGNDGAQGATGPIGSTGNVGPQGATGPIGLTGNVGPQGATGPIGLTGNDGAQGATGPTGPIGPTGPLVPGLISQTLRNNGTDWVANDMITNNGTNVGINSNPYAGAKLYVSRPYNNFGPDSSTIYGYRGGNSNTTDGGISWSLEGVDAAIKGYSDYGNSFSAGIAGYGVLDYPNSTALIGSNYMATVWGALAYNDLSATLWAGYFNGNVKATGSMTTSRLISTVATGTSPVTVTSTTLNTNLNADLLDGQHASSFQPALSGTADYNAYWETSNTLGSEQWVSAVRGGTGMGSYTTGDLLFANSSTSLSKLAGVATGNVLLSGGVGTSPAWGKVTLTGHVSGTLPVANGGSGQSNSLVKGGVIYAQSAIAMASTPAGTAGQVLKSNGTAAPTWSNNNGIIASSVSGATTALTTSWQNYTNGTVTITAPYSGTVEVIANVILFINHMTGTGERIYLAIGTTPTEGGVIYDYAISDTPASMPTYVTMPSYTVVRRFTVTAGTYTYYLNGMMTSLAGSNDYIYYSSMRAVFY